MNSFTFIYLFFTVLFNSGTLTEAPKSNTATEATEICLSAEERALYDAINEYRKQKKLPPVPLSMSLTQVSKAHAGDLNENYDLDQRAICNPHSWSDQGTWTACCYSDDHKNPKCMWEKPKEVAGYPAAGYEIVYWHSNQAKPGAALEGWKKSPGHNQVIVNLDIWKKVEWKAVGVAIQGNYAIAWFGDTADEKGSAELCDDKQNP